MRVICLRVESSTWASNISRFFFRMDLNILVLSSISYKETVPFKGFLFEVASRENPPSGLLFLEQAP